MSERLGARRRRVQRRTGIAFVILLLLLTAAALYGLQQPAVRISHIEVFGTSEQLGEVATRAMQGSYLGIIPRDSTFFIPEGAIRNQILAAHQDIAAVSIFRKGFDGLVIKIDYRAPIARWCGLAPSPGVEEYCYVFDASGVIYAAAVPDTQTINTFTLYAPLQDGVLEPLRARIAHADQLPSTFDLARELATFGSAVSHIVIRGDEVDDYLVSGTRVTYVLGQEQVAYAALVSAKNNLDLADGSLEYVDLRFERKVYIKKKDSSRSGTSEGTQQQ